MAGPVVAQMQATFLDNWLKVTGQVLHGEAHFPFIKPAGGSNAQMFPISPSSGGKSMKLMYQLAIKAENRSIDRLMAYFVPDELRNQTLLNALRRSVRLRVITPFEIMDTDTVRSASRTIWAECWKPMRKFTHTSQPLTTEM